MFRLSLIIIKTKNFLANSILSRTCFGLDRRSLLRQVGIVFAECISTAMLLLFGCMGCVGNDVLSNSPFQSAFTFGLVVLICIQCFGCISGAHMNPAVTLAALVYGNISWGQALAYFIAQMLGAFIGYGLLKAVLPESAIYAPKGVCITGLHDSLNVWQGFSIEILITSGLIAFCCGVWDPRNATFQDSVGVRFGLAVSALSLIAGQLTGASMNPARSFAPAIWNGAWDNHWIYWAGPLTGSLITSLLYRFALKRTGEDSGEEDSALA